MSETLEIEVDSDTAEKLSDLPDGRLEEVVRESIRDAVMVQEDAKSYRDSLRERMGIDGDRDSEELEGLSEVERKQAELRAEIVESVAGPGPTTGK